MKKTLSLLLTLALALTLISIPAVAEEELPTLTMMVQGDNTPSEENSVLAALEEYIGADIQISVYSSEDYSTKLNTLIASGDEPDIYSVFDTNTLLELRDAGRIIDMEPYLDEYGPDIKEYYGDDIYTPLVNDGGVYGLVSDAGLYVSNLTIRLDWLENVGLEIPTDLDSYYEVLYAFTYGDPDGNGIDDTYGIAPCMEYLKSFSHIFAAYGIPVLDASTSILLEDGTVTTFLKHPDFLEAIEYIRKLYQDGLIYPDFATITSMQSYELLWNGTVGIIDFQAVGTTNNWYPGRYTFDVPDDPSEIFGFIYLNGNGSVKVYADYSTADVVISSSCEYPELAVKLVNYMYYTEEGQNLTYLGVEGVHYQWIDEEEGTYERLGDYTDDIVHRADGAFCYNDAGGYTLENAETRLMNATTQEAQSAEWEVALDYAYIAQALETRTEYGSTLDEIVEEALATLIVTEDDPEEVLAEYIARWEEEGGLEYEAEATAAYAEENA